MLSTLLDELWLRVDLWILLKQAVLPFLCIIILFPIVIRISVLYRCPRHLRKLGLTARSNLADQDKISDGHLKSDIEKPRPSVKALYIHPIKSCAPIEVTRALLTKTGFAFDRSFVFATEIYESGSKTPSEWRFISQRTKPQMSQIKVDLWLPQHYDLQQLDQAVSGGFIRVSFPSLHTSSFTSRLCEFTETGKWSSRPQVRFTVPLMPTDAECVKHNIKIKTFNIHSRNATGLDLGAIPSLASALPLLKTFLKIPARQQLTLLRCTSDTLTRTTLNLAPLSHIGTPAVHGYTDQQPLHLINLSSVRSVSSLLPMENQPLDARRFRANIYISDVEPFEEERWKRCRITSKRSRSAVQLSIVCRTSRCTMPNVDFNTGNFDHESPSQGKKKGRAQPSTTLIEHRTVENGNPAAMGYLGMHCVPEDACFTESAKRSESAWIEVGDQFEVMEEGEHLYGSTADSY